GVRLGRAGAAGPGLAGQSRRERAGPDLRGDGALAAGLLGVGAAPPLPDDRRPPDELGDGRRGPRPGDLDFSDSPLEGVRMTPRPLARTRTRPLILLASALGLL